MEHVIGTLQHRQKHRVGYILWSPFYLEMFLFMWVQMAGHLPHKVQFWTNGDISDPNLLKKIPNLFPLLALLLAARHTHREGEEKSGFHLKNVFSNSHV